MTTTTDKMNLVLPEVSITSGPEWATLLNALIELIDEHDHSTGSGTKIGPSGINITATLEMNNNKLTETQVVALQNLSATQTSDTGSLQRVGSNLYWINSAGTAVQITSGGSLNIAGTGAFSTLVVSSYPYSVTTADSQKVLVIDTSAARTINLPAATDSVHVILKDGTGTANTYNISVVPNGTDLIEGSNTTYLIDWNYGALTLISDGISKWWAV